MKLLLISEKAGCAACVSVGKRSVIALLVLLLVAIPLLIVGYGSDRNDPPSTVAMSNLDELRAEIDQQREDVTATRNMADANLNALTLRLGQLQSRIARLDALGHRLTQIAGIEEGEFDFSAPPAQGGPTSSIELGSIGIDDFVDQLDALAIQLEDRALQLGLIETMWMHQSLQQQVFPAGKPIDKGWLSSKYGKRADPITGKQEFHKGIDLAAREGTDIKAVAAGVVTWADARYNYGNLVEINHGNGYVTRYAHCKSILVSVGDRVDRGDVIATVGSTGRSTGPHIHFEVVINGKEVNPDRYLNQVTR